MSTNLELEEDMLKSGGALLFPKDPILMRAPVFEEKFGDNPFRSMFRK